MNRNVGPLPKAHPESTIIQPYIATSLRAIKHSHMLCRLFLCKLHNEVVGNFGHMRAIGPT
ncbi:MAG: hypothetical protein WBO24_04635, partial [Nitrospirales bacterium]